MGPDGTRIIAHSWRAPEVSKQAQKIADTPKSPTSLLPFVYPSALISRKPTSPSKYCSGPSFCVWERVTWG